MNRSVNLGFILFGVFILLSGGIQAQHRPDPSVPHLPEKTPGIILPLQDNDHLVREEVAARQPNRPPRFALALATDISPQRMGTWQTTSKEAATWRYRIQSPGAHSLNLGFSEFSLPQGAMLYLYSANGQYRLGPLSAADGEFHNTYWSPVIPGDDMYIEIQVPQEKIDETVVTISQVNHDFMGLGKVVSGSCNLDVVCSARDGWALVDQFRDIIQSVGLVTIDGQSFCSGFLINNSRRDCRPFFMTAEHCDIDAGNASSVVVYWDYQNGICRQPNSAISGQPGNGSLSKTNSGAIWRAEHKPSDMTLLELDDPIPPQVDAFLAGWSAAPEGLTDTAITIHHPSNEEKRISFEFDRPYRGEWQKGTASVPDGNYLVIEHWEVGTTEEGSSGAPLFNRHKQVIGQLHGGRAACGNRQYDAFGWFGSSWDGENHPTNSLKNWLDPERTGILTLPGQWITRCRKLISVDTLWTTLCAGDTLNYQLTLNQAFEGQVEANILAISPGIEIVHSIHNQSYAAGAVIPVALTQTPGATTGPGSVIIQFVDRRDTITTVLNLRLSKLPQPFSLISGPADQLPFPVDRLSFRWTTSSYASHYTIELVDTTDGRMTVFQETTTGQSIALPTNILDSEKVYSWIIAAHSPCGKSASLQGIFTTGPDASVMLLDEPTTICSGTSNAIDLILGRGFRGPVDLMYELTPAEAGEVIFEEKDHTSILGGQPITIHLRLHPELNTDSVRVIVRATDGFLFGESSFLVPVFQKPKPPGQLAPTEGATIFPNALMTWTDQAEGTSFLIQISRDSLHQDLVLQEEVKSIPYMLTELSAGGRYFWRVMALNNCGNTWSSTQSFQYQTEYNTSLNGTAINISPNPAREAIEIITSMPLSEGQVFVYNIQGKEILRRQMDSNARNTKLPVRNWPAGMYIIRIRQFTTSVSFRVIVQSF